MRQPTPGTTARAVITAGAVMMLPLLLMGTGGGQTLPAPQPGPRRLQAVIGPVEVRLDDARSIHLAGIHVPPAAEDGTSFAMAAQALIRSVLDGVEVTLDPRSPPLDRHGRLRAQLHGGPGGWVQGELVRRGFAIVTPDEDVAPASLQALLALERTARDGRAGLWGKGMRMPFPAERVTAPEGAYVLVSGRVRGVATARDYLYLNFGADWRRDFTIRVPLRARRGFARQGLDLERLEGRNLEVRGYLFDLNGPMIELVHRAQIEVLP